MTSVSLACITHTDQHSQIYYAQWRWKHVGTVLGYIEDGQRFNDNAVATALQDT